MVPVWSKTGERHVVTMLQVPSTCFRNHFVCLYLTSIITVGQKRSSINWIILSESGRGIANIEHFCTGFDRALEMPQCSSTRFSLLTASLNRRYLTPGLFRSRYLTGWSVNEVNWKQTVAVCFHLVHYCITNSISVTCQCWQSDNEYQGCKEASIPIFWLTFITLSFF